MNFCTPCGAQLGNLLSAQGPPPERDFSISFNPILFQPIMSPPHTPPRPTRCEADTTKRARFFHALQNKKDGQSFNEICRQKGIEIPPSTGRDWKRQFEQQGEKAIRRTRRQSTRLGQPPKVSEAELTAVFDPQHPLHTAPYKSFEFDLGSRQLHKRYARLNARRFKRATSSALSAKNKRARIDYGRCHRRESGKNLTSFWQYVYFTDEAHFNSKELANAQGYKLHRFGHPEDRLPP